MCVLHRPQSAHEHVRAVVKARGAVMTAVDPLTSLSRHHTQQARGQMVDDNNHKPSQAKPGVSNLSILDYYT
jgi:hypothetical protein